MLKPTNIIILAALCLTLIGCPNGENRSTQQDNTHSQKSSSESKKPSQTQHSQTPVKSENTLIEIQTNKGNIVVELNAEKAPISVDNFLTYVDEGHYDGTIFHRVIDNFMIQGGGFTEDMQQKQTHAPIKNEADNGLSNLRGTIAMARTQIVDSATCQFFINVKDNFFLDHQAPTPQAYGYCVFGKVVEGMDVVDTIKTVETTTISGMGDVPTEPVIIEKIVRK